MCIRILRTDTQCIRTLHLRRGIAILCNLHCRLHNMPPRRMANTIETKTNGKKNEDNTPKSQLPCALQTSNMLFFCCCCGTRMNAMVAGLISCMHAYYLVICCWRRRQRWRLRVACTIKIFIMAYVLFCSACFFFSSSSLGGIVCIVSTYDRRHTAPPKLCDAPEPPIADSITRESVVTVLNVQRSL